MIQTIPSFDKLIAQLGFLLVVDHCSRNCSHCQAFGERSPVERIPFDELENISFMIKRAAAIAQISVPIPLHCWRVSDPLDYYCKTGSGWKTCYDVAELWRRVFGQGLYVVTNGSEGTKIGREAVLGLSAQPDLLNQIKLTITPYDQEWGTPKYKADILWDLQQLHLLWQYPCAQRPNELLFRVNAKCSKCSKNELRQFLLELVREVGGWVECCRDDDDRVARASPQSRSAWAVASSGVSASRLATAPAKAAIAHVVSVGPPILMRRTVIGVSSWR